MKHSVEMILVTGPRTQSKLTALISAGQIINSVAPLIWCFSYLHVGFCYVTEN